MRPSARIITPLLLALAALGGCERPESIVQGDLAPPAPALAQTPTIARASPITDDGFVDVAGVIDLYVIEAAQVALAGSRTPALQAVARQIGADHTLSRDALARAALGASAPLPTAVDDQKRAWILALRAAADPAALERLFLEQMAAATEEGMRAREAYLSAGSDPGLRAYSTETLEKVRSHQRTLATLSSQTRLAGTEPLARS